MKSNGIKLSTVLCTLILLSAYIDMPLRAFGILIPSAVTLSLAIPFFWIFRRSFLKKNFLPIISLITFFLFSAIIFSPNIDIGEKLQGFMQVSMAMLLSYCYYSFTIKYPDAFKTIVLLCTLAIASLAFAEFLGISKNASDAFREIAFPHDLVSYAYSSSERDLDLTGFERPKVFSAEPSFVSIFFFIFSISTLKVYNSTKHLILLLILSAGMIYLLRSPILFLLPPFLAYIFYLEERIQINQKVSLLILMLFCFSFFFGYPLFLELIGRPVNSGELLTGDLSRVNSQTVRLSLPWVTAHDVLTKSPLFGVGISGKSAVETFSSFGLPAQTVMGTNNIANIFIYFGILGGSIFLLILIWIFRRLAPASFLSFLLFFFLYSGMLGGFETIRYWLFLFVVLSAYRYTELNPHAKHHYRALNQANEAITLRN